MKKNTPIIVVEDDIDDREIMQTIFKELNVESRICFFETCEKAYRYLKTTKDHPFIIFCDINLPKQNGMEFKSQIDGDKELRQKSIPFVFYTTASTESIIDKAYATLTIQGFFVKPASYKEAKALVKRILDYWEHCKHPKFN